MTIRVVTPTLISCNHKAVKAQLPFKGNDEGESRPPENNQSNKGVMVFLGLALAGVLVFVFRKKLGLSKEVAKATEEAAKPAENAVANTVAKKQSKVMSLLSRFRKNSSDKWPIRDRIRYGWNEYVCSFPGKAFQYAQRTICGDPAKKAAKEVRKATERIAKRAEKLARETAEAQATSSPAVLDLI